MFIKIFWLIIFVTSGLGLIIYTEKIKRFTGNFSFAEKWFGSGGTYNFFKLLGIAIIIGSFLWITGTLNHVVPDFLTNSNIAN
jgi:hypothetical protein